MLYHFEWCPKYRYNISGKEVYRQDYEFCLQLVAWFPLNSNTNDYSGNGQNLVFAKCSYSYLGGYTAL